MDVIIQYVVPIIAVIVSGLAYYHSQKIYWETVKKPFTLTLLPDREITFWESNRHFGTVSLNMTFFNSGNEPDLITDLWLVKLDESLSTITNHMHASECLTSRVEVIHGKEFGVNKAFSGIQLGPKSENTVRIMFSGDREDVFSPGMAYVYIAYKTVMKSEWRLSNVIITCDTSNEFFDNLINRSISIPLIIKNNKYEGRIVKDPSDQLWE